VSLLSSFENGPDDAGSRGTGGAECRSWWSVTNSTAVTQLSTTSTADVPTPSLWWAVPATGSPLGTWASVGNTSLGGVLAVLGQDVMTVVEMTAFAGLWNTVVPAIAVLSGFNFLLGGTAVALLKRASRAEVQ
jgi:hypothetical protein